MRSYLACSSAGGPIWFHISASSSIFLFSTSDVLSQRLLSSFWYMPNAFWLSNLHEVASTHPPVLPWIVFFNSPFAWTERTLLPVHFFIPLNFSDDSLVLPYVWNQVYTPCQTIFCLIPYLNYHQLYRLTFFLKSLSSLDHWGFCFFISS